MSPDSLDSFLVQDKDCELSSFDWGPKHDDLDLVLFTNVQMLLAALTAITKLFEVNKKEELKKISQVLSVLAPLLGASKSEGEKTTEADWK